MKLELFKKKYENSTNSKLLDHVKTGNQIICWTDKGKKIYKIDDSVKSVTKGRDEVLRQIAKKSADNNTYTNGITKRVLVKSLSSRKRFNTVDITVTNNDVAHNIIEVSVYVNSICAITYTGKKNQTLNEVYASTLKALDNLYFLENNNDK